MKKFKWNIVENSRKNEKNTLSVIGYRKSVINMFSKWIPYRCLERVPPSSCCQYPRR